MIAQLLPWFGLSLRQPRKAMRALLGLGWAPQTNWLFFAAASMSAAAIASLQQALILMAHPGDLGAVNFLELALRGLMLQILAVCALTVAGRALGGAARIDEIALMQGWLQALLILPGAALALIMLAAPELALMGLLALGIATLTYLVAGMTEASRFNCWGRGLLAMILAFTGLLVIANLFAIPLI